MSRQVQNVQEEREQEVSSTNTAVIESKPEPVNPWHRKPEPVSQTNVWQVKDPNLGNDQPGGKSVDLSNKTTEWYNQDVRMMGGYQGGNDRREGGNDRREGGNDRREGGNDRREGGNDRREGGNDRREGGNDRREGGNDRREGGNDRREGGNDRREGRNDRREGGNDRREGGNDRREGGNDRREGGNDRREGGGRRQENMRRQDSRDNNERRSQQVDRDYNKRKPLDRKPQRNNWMQSRKRYGDRNEEEYNSVEKDVNTNQNARLFDDASNLSEKIPQDAAGCSTDDKNTRVELQDMSNDYRNTRPRREYEGRRPRNNQRPSREGQEGSNYDRPEFGEGFENENEFPERQYSTEERTDRRRSRGGASGLRNNYRYPPRGDPSLRNRTRTDARRGEQ